MRRLLLSLLAVAVIALAPAASAEEYQSDFESLFGSATGVELTGQDFYYLPPATTSVHFYVYTYAGNALGLPDNPTGGSQFIGGCGPGSPTFARAQRDLFFEEGGTWVAAFDFAGTYLGAPPSANNLGSFSLRSSDVANDFIYLLSWVDPNNPTVYQAGYLAYDAAGTQAAQPGYMAGPEWQALELNHWYRAWTKMNLDTNMIVEVKLIDLQSGQEWSYTPTDWYLEGGAAGGVGLPMSFRWFAGGGVANNCLGFDNALLVMAPSVGACCLIDGTCLLITEDECVANPQFAYFLPDQVCEPNPCVPVPVEESTWGSIKAKFHR